MSVREMNVRDAHQSLHRYKVVDVREPHELLDGAIPQAENVPLGSLARVAARWDRDQPLMVICRSGGRSSRAAAELVRLGFRTVVNVNGGMLAWSAHGLPTSARSAA